MPLLQARDVPQDLYDRLGKVAAAERRSVAQETIVLLRQALELAEPSLNRRIRVIEEAARLAKAVPANQLDPTALIREDRDR